MAETKQEAKLAKATPKKPRRKSKPLKPSPRRTGRPSKLTPERVERICQALVTGVSIQTACVATGLTRGAYHQWVRKGEISVEEGKGPEECPYVDFLHRVTQARSKAELRFAGIVAKAAETDYRAAIEALRRRWPEDWGDKNSTKVEANVKQEMTIRIAWPEDTPIGGAVIETTGSSAMIPSRTGKAS